METPCYEKQRNILQISDNSNLKIKLDLRLQGGYGRQSGIVRMFLEVSVVFLRVG